MKAVTCDSVTQNLRAGRGISWISPQVGYKRKHNLVYLAACRSISSSILIDVLPKPC